MRQKLYSMVFAVAALLCFSLASALAQHEQHGAQHPNVAKNTVYTCPMHPEVTSDKPGKCPKCGMALVVKLVAAPAGGPLKMAPDARQAIAMAYRESVTVFARALRQHAEQSGAVNGDFARDMVAEIRRGIEQMERHQQEHLDAMTPEARAQTGATMKQTEPHRAGVKGTLEALERETGVEAPDRARVSQLAGELLRHFDEMSKARGAHEGHKH